MVSSSNILATYNCWAARKKETDFCFWNIRKGDPTALLLLGERDKKSPETFGSRAPRLIVNFQLSRFTRGMFPRVNREIRDGIG